MNEEYDAIVMGTGLTECVVSGLLSTNGYKVLHIDKNEHHGGESASLHLDQLYERFKPESHPDYEKMGDSQEYNVDIIPKFIMANGKLEKMLHLTGVTKYNMSFVKISKCYVMAKSRKIYQVPSSVKEVASSRIMGLFEKNRCRKFLTYIHNYDPEKPGKAGDLKKMSFNELYKRFGLNADTIDFMGHAIALETTEEYRERPAFETSLKMKLYAESVAKYGDSPFVYPQYGLGELPQAFAFLSSVKGGTQMLRTPITKIHYGDDGKVNGIESSKYPGEKAKCKFVVADPSYFPEKVEKKGQIIRVINILNHPIQSVKNSKSCQIIIPQRQTERKNDIYISCTTSIHKVCPKGKYIVTVSTTIETDDDPISEVKEALKLLGEIEEQFVFILDYFEPISDGEDDGVFISKSYDSTSHFETCSQDIIDIFERITGKQFSWKEPEKENGVM